MKDPLARPAFTDCAEDILNLKQAAALLGVHYMTVYRYVRQGRLPAERNGTEWRVARSTLESFNGHPPVAVESAETSSTQRIRWDSRLEGCLLAGDETAAWSVIENALAAGHSPTECYV